MMNVDEEIHETEKRYFSSLIKVFDLDASMLESFISFAKKPDEEAVNELLAEISKKDNLKFNFMIDVLIPADIDEKLHKNEKELIENYFDMLLFSKDEKNLIQNTLINESGLKRVSLRTKCGNPYFLQG